MLNKLNSMMNNTESELTKEVIAIALNHIGEYEEEDGYFNDILNYGCASGIVVELIYNSDCKDFFTRHMEEIFDIYNELRDNGYVLNKDIDATTLSWLAFEQTINNIANEIF